MTRHNPQLRSTPQLDFLTGHFKLMANWRISYLSCTMEGRDLAEYLKLATELPGAEQIRWEINELYQRDIDWERVQRKIVPYLLSEENPQFFNALTVALLPYKGDAEGLQTIDDFSGDIWKAPSLDNVGFQQELTIGPISMGFFDAWKSPDDPGFMSGQFRWNTDQVFPVAIDGQHRLAAFKEIASDGTDALRDTRVPVIFLLFDSRFGYSSPGGRTVEVLRKLFIDLNKHAATVSRARQILLDDRDPYARCVRQVVAPKLEDGTDSLTKGPSPRLPLSLVDWHTEQAKFDDGPCVTTILGLDQAVTKFLNGKVIGDMTSYGALNRQIDRLVNKLGVDLGEAKRRLHEAKDQESAFSYTDEDLEEIEQAFRRVMSGSLVRILSEFRPYATLIELRRKHQSLSLDFQYWFQLYRDRLREAHAGKAFAEYGRFMNRVGNRDEPETRRTQKWFEQRLDEINDFKKANLAFNVVFQRALFEAMIEFSKLGVDAVEELKELRQVQDWDPDFGTDTWDEPSDDITDDEDLPEDDESPARTGGTSSLAIEERAQEMDRKSDIFVRYLNQLVDDIPSFLNLHTELQVGETPVRLWQGTLRRPGEATIDFSQAASKRAGDLIFLSLAMQMFDEHVEPERRSDFDGFWEYVQERQGALAGSVDRVLTRWCSTTGGGGAGARILNAREEDPTLEAMYEEARLRCQAIWEELEL